MKSGSIYMDNCVTTPLAPEVLAAMKPYWEEQFWYPSSFVSTGEQSSANINSFAAAIAKSIGANPIELHFTSGGTLANNIAIKGLAHANAKIGKHIICSVVDYPDLLTNADYLENQGFDITYLSADAEGFIDLRELKSAIRPDTIMFMTTIVNHVVGTIQPMEEIKQILASADHRIFFHVDACQAYGKLRLDVFDLGVDTMSISAHKIHGPQGVGALYVKSGIKLSQLIHGVTRIDNLQTGGIGIALLAGFAKAAELVFADLNANIAHLRGLSDYLLASLETNIPHIELNGPRGEKRACHNVNVTISYIEGEAIAMMLDLNGITVATGSACASQGLQANYVLMAMGKNHVQSHGSMKFTLSRFNTKDEIDIVVLRLKEITATLRARSPLYQQIIKQEK
ncbi:MAG: cysteine desulfurase family protein [Candidatus Cloacimonadaceae bacterium]|nr:cysteine desulfurase family protein [Candidatus Cloacimonadaceae bacterium]MDP3114038.1 cysteine desulfurase family protein [Candidatus Cloacimonadaceae bacterium]